MQRGIVRVGAGLVLAVGGLVTSQAWAEAPAKAAAVFDSYAGVVEARLAKQHSPGAEFLAGEAGSDEGKARLRRGEVIVEQMTPPVGLDVPGALLHHWRGAAFVSGAKAADFENLLRDFDGYARTFAPQVMAAKTLAADGDRVQGWMRVRQKHVITVVMDSTYNVEFGRAEAQDGLRGGWSAARSVRIAEIDDAGMKEERELKEDHGFLWRMNTYWSWEEADGGLYVQIESVTLTRGIPAGLGWAVKPFAESIPRESLEFTLEKARLQAAEQQVTVMATNTAVKTDMQFAPAPRMNEALTAKLERRALVWMAERAPKWLTSDQLTLLGLSAQIGAGIGYALARWDRRALLLTVVCIVLNWLGDSLDGTLARVRRQQRPRYGFYVDHIVDIFGAAALMGGLSVSGLVHWQVATAMLVAFLLLAGESYLATYTLGRFELSQGWFGPTELRILLIAGTLRLVFRPYVTFLGHRWLLFDVGGSIAAAGMLAMAAVVTVRHTAQLYREEPLP